MRAGAREGRQEPSSQAMSARAHQIARHISRPPCTYAPERLTGEGHDFQAVGVSVVLWQWRGLPWRVCGACCCARRAVRQAATPCIRPAARCEVRFIVHGGLCRPPLSASETLTPPPLNSAAQAARRGARCCAAYCLGCRRVRRRRAAWAQRFAPRARASHAVGCAASGVLAGAASPVQQQTGRAACAARSGRRHRLRRGGAGVRR